jgi:gluconate 2-dehydrogenase gamma chain
VTETRRHALKLLGTVGATCAFPFAGDELYGQHVHPMVLQTSSSVAYAPTFFTAVEYATLSRLVDIIIPPTETPGAAAAGVPEYIDRVVTLNAQHQPVIRTGLAWLDRRARQQSRETFATLGEQQQIAILQPLSDEMARQQRDALRARFRSDGKGGTVYYYALTDKDAPAASPSAAAASSRVSIDDSDLGVRFFRLIKNLTADGYYTSRVGLLQELGYTGNTALATFPGCDVPEQ